MANFRPLYDRVLVKRVEAQAMTSSGLHLPETAKEKPQRAVVVAVGTGRVTKSGDTVPLTVEAGQTVLFGKYAGDEVKLDGVTHLIMREEDILAVIVD